MDQITNIKALLQSFGALQFAVLVGSRADGSQHQDSDWDIAVFVDPVLPPIERFNLIEQLRMASADAIGASPDSIDMIDLHDAGLAMREQVVNHGMILVERDGAMFCRFCVRVWRELEDFYWEQQHAA